MSRRILGAIMVDEATACPRCESRNVRFRKTKALQFVCAKCGHEFSEASVEQARREKIPELIRRPASDREKYEAISLINSSFPPGEGGQFYKLHPDDVREVVRNYKALVAKQHTSRALSELAKEGGPDFTTDPAAVKPPEQAAGASGEVKSFDELTPEEKAEVLLKHRLEVVAINLANHHHVSQALEQAGASPTLASRFARFVMSAPKEAAERRRQAELVARDAFLSDIDKEERTRKDDTSHNYADEEDLGDWYAAKGRYKGSEGPPTAERPSTSLGARKAVVERTSEIEPLGVTIAISAFKADDFVKVRDKYLASGNNRLSEFDSPKEFAGKIKDALRHFAEARSSYPTEALTSPPDPAEVFRERVRSLVARMKPEAATTLSAAFATAEQDVREHGLAVTPDAGAQSGGTNLKALVGVVVVVLVAILGWWLTRGR